MKRRDLIEAIEKGWRGWQQESGARVLMLAGNVSEDLLQGAREWQRQFAAEDCEVHVVAAADGTLAQAAEGQERTEGVTVHLVPQLTGDMDPKSLAVRSIRLAALGQLVLSGPDVFTAIHAYDETVRDAAEWLAESSRVPLVTAVTAQRSLIQT